MFAIGGKEMAIEHQLKDKTYYQMFINEHENIHPILALGEAFQEEAQKDLPDLADIRFAQGEVYFHHKDYEAAIFKWENITNELEPWARKNIADAYYELGMLSQAEDIYTALEVDDPTLRAEVALKLFSLYVHRGKVNEAVTTIKKAVQTNPDYPNVTSIARDFFETQEDWSNAVELAVNEAKRTGSLEWFDILLSYIEMGVTKAFAPNYFTQVLVNLYHIDVKKFEQLVSAFWNSWRNENTYLTWMNEVNHLLLNLDLNRDDNWSELSKLHKETYISLIAGGYLIKELQDYVPVLLTNWMRLADNKNIVPAAASVLAWNELFPASLAVNIVEEAEQLISVTSFDMDELEECLKLFEAIMTWAESNEMGNNNRVRWIVEKIVDFDTQHLLVTGLCGSGKSTFINTILGEDLQDSPTSSVVMFSHGQVEEIFEINDEECRKLSGFSDFRERMGRLRNALNSIIEFNYPNNFLKEQKFALMDTPGLNGNQHDHYEVFKYLQAADSILFVLDANEPLTNKERAIINQIQEQAPDLPIHFIISKMDVFEDEQDALRIFEETKEAIHSSWPDAQVMPFSSQYDRNQQIGDLKEFLKLCKNTRNIEDKRLAKLLYYIRTTIAGLLQKRIDIENQLIETVRWNEEMHMKLNGGLNQLKDTEIHKSRMITKMFAEIKESVEVELIENVPKILRACAELIKEDSNFSTIHLDLNKEMNNRIQDYLEEQVMPTFYRSMQEWIEQCQEELGQSQEFLYELGDGFNQMYGEEYVKLDCDFKVLDDWRRDIDRMTSHFQLETVNILLRRTPSQILLKSAGKLFGALSQNKSMLFNKYKSFVENEDYYEIAKTVSRQFFQPFELFEKSFERDIHLFFKNPLNQLNRCLEEAQSEIELNQEKLKELNANPELFRDPLTLFEVRLRQFEWMTVAGKGMQTVY